MKKNLIILLLSFAAGGYAQDISLKKILQSVEDKNPELRMARQQTAIQKQTDRTENNLQDPSVEYVYQWGTPTEIGKSSELNVTQSFDFPTLYAERGKLSRERAVWYGYQYEGVRRDVLLRTQQLFYDLVLVNRKLELLQYRRQLALELEKNASVYLDQGAINSIESRKLKLEFLNLRTEEVNLRTDREKLLQQLSVLNGGISVDVVETRFSGMPPLPAYTELRAEILSDNAELRSLDQEKVVASKQLSVSRQQNLPSIELGYRRTTGLEEKFNGVIMGLSIPLFQNRGKVRQARMQQQYVDMQRESALSSMESALRTSYDEAVSLKKLLDEYAGTLSGSDGYEALKRALAAHEITIIDYFTELSGLYQSDMNRLDLENRYYKMLAELYKNRF